MDIRELIFKGENPGPCPKCGETSGNDWSQCEGTCPMPMSPWHPTTSPVNHYVNEVE